MDSKNQGRPGAVEGDAEALRQENRSLRARLKQAAEMLHQLQADLRDRTGETAKLRETTERLVFTKDALERRLKTQSEAAESELERLRSDRKKLETALRAIQSQGKERAQLLLQERLVDLRGSAAARSRLEVELGEARTALGEALVRIRDMEAEIDAREVARESGEPPAAATSNGWMSAKVERESVAPQSVEADAAAPLSREDFGAALLAGTSLVRSAAFARHEPVTISDIRVSDWLQQADSLAELVLLAGQEISEKDLLEAVFRFYQRGLVVLAT